MNIKQIVGRAKHDLKVSWEILKEIDVMARPVGKEVYRMATSEEAVEVYKVVGKGIVKGAVAMAKGSYRLGKEFRAVIDRIASVEHTGSGVGDAIAMIEAVSVTEADESLGLALSIPCCEANMDGLEVAETVSEGLAGDLAGVERTVALPLNVSRLKKIYAACFGVAYREIKGVSREELREAIEKFGRGKIGYHECLEVA